MSGDKRPHRLQKWERQAILDAYVAGEKVDAIAAEFGVSRSYPPTLARSRGIKPRPNGRPKSSEHAERMLDATC